MNDDLINSKLENLQIQINALNKRIDDLRDNINKSISFWGHSIAFAAVFFTVLQFGLALFIYKFR